MRLKLITAPTAEALTLDDVKSLHLREAGTDQDVRIEGLITAARAEFENFTGRILMSSTWDLYMDEFPDGDIELPQPLTSVTSIKYQDTADAEQTFGAASYVVDTVDHGAPYARVCLAYGESWPDTYAEPNVVVVRFVAGYANAGSVPQDIKNGLYLYISQMYEYREPYSVGNIVTPVNPYLNCWWHYRRVPI